MDTGVIAGDIPNPLNEEDFRQLKQTVSTDEHAEVDRYGIDKYRQALEFVTQHV